MEPNPFSLDKISLKMVHAGLNERSLINVHAHLGGRNLKPNRSFSQKERMLNKASILFWKNGYQSTTMRQIAKAYGCKPSNIYNFFPNKESILYSMLLEQMKRLIAIIRPIAYDSTVSHVEQLRRLIKQHLSHTLNYKKSYKLLFDVGLHHLSTSKKKDIIALRDEYDRLVKRILDHGITSGEFRRINTKLSSFTIASMITRTILWYSSKGPLSVDEIADFIMDFTLRGLERDAARSSRNGNGKRTNRSETKYLTASPFSLHGS
jgi:AcrR family transcriptional regulator